jgi:hypothetical protein
VSNPIATGALYAVLAAIAFGLATPFIQRFGLGLAPRYPLHTNRVSAPSRKPGPRFAAWLRALGCQILPAEHNAGPFPGAVVAGHSPRQPRAIRGRDLPVRTDRWRFLGRKYILIRKCLLLFLSSTAARTPWRRASSSATSPLR